MSLRAGHHFTGLDDVTGAGHWLPVAPADSTLTLHSGIKQGVALNNFCIASPAHMPANAVGEN